MSGTTFAADVVIFRVAYHLKINLQKSCRFALDFLCDKSSPQLGSDSLIKGSSRFMCLHQWSTWPWHRCLEALWAWSGWSTLSCATHVVSSPPLRPRFKNQTPPGFCYVPTAAPCDDVFCLLGWSIEVPAGGPNRGLHLLLVPEGGTPFARVFVQSLPPVWTWRNLCPIL